MSQPELVLQPVPVHFSRLSFDKIVSAWPDNIRLPSLLSQQCLDAAQGPD